MGCRITINVFCLSRSADQNLFQIFPDYTQTLKSVYQSLEKNADFCISLSDLDPYFIFFICSSHKYTSCRGCICPHVRQWLRIAWWLTTSLPACVPRFTKKQIYISIKYQTDLASTYPRNGILNGNFTGFMLPSGSSRFLVVKSDYLKI